MMHRRRFLATTAAATISAHTLVQSTGAVTSGAATAGAGAAGPFTGKIKKAVKYGMVQEKLSPLDKFKLLKDLGYDGVEPGASSAKDYVQSLQKASEKTELPIHGVVNSSNPNIIKAVDVARAYGANSVLLVVPTNAKKSYLQNYKERQDIIRKAIPHAEKHNIRLLIENVWASFLIEPISMVRFIEELESPMVGCYFDVGNNVRWGYPEHWIEVLGKKHCVKLDIKEYSRKLQRDEGLGKGFRVELGEGSVDWKRVREELAKIDYRGWATAEVRGGDRKRLKDIADRMDKVLGLV